MKKVVSQDRTYLHAVAGEVRRFTDGTKLYGVGIGKNIVVASLKAVVRGFSLAIRE